MLTINSLKAKEFHLFEILYEIHNVNEKISFFYNKYGVNFPEFEDLVKNADTENFEVWEDYMQWKASQKQLEQLQADKRDIEIGNYQIS
jgi:hypothetical protein